MRSFRNSHESPLPIRVALLALTTVLVSGWTCNALFVSCQDSVAAPQITSLSPQTVSIGTDSILIVTGNAFVSQSQIMWNGNALQTTFIDWRHLSATITQQTFDSFGGVAGSTIQISVRSQVQGAIRGCPSGGTSGILVLDIN